MDVFDVVGTFEDSERVKNIRHSQLVGQSLEHLGQRVYHGRVHARLVHRENNHTAAFASLIGASVAKAVNVRLVGR